MDKNQNANRPHHTDPTQVNEVIVSRVRTAMVNLLDATALMSWSVGLEVMESVDLSIGGYHGAGEGFEFGLSGHLGYLQVAAYF